METRRKTVTLPSEITVEIRKPGILGFQKIKGCIPDLSAVDTAGKTPEEITAQLSPEQIDGNLQAAIAMVEACTIKPAFRAEPGDGEDSIDDLSLADFWALAEAITDFADLQGEAKKIAPLPSAQEVSS
jgi:hypothetical protein